MLSICIPAHEAGFPLLQRTLRNLSYQTCLDFEVVVAVDGPGEFSPPETPYPLRVVRSERTEEKTDIAHRNHARNRAAEAARGELLWFADQDFLWDTWTVDHLLRAKHTPLTPVLVSIRDTPERWLAAEGAFDQEHLWSLTTQGAEWAGFARCYRPHGGVVVEKHEIPEGFPLVRASEFTGFDERFLGYGGNKEAYVKTLQDYRLLASARGYHQPHHRPPQDEGLSAKNKAMYDAIQERA